MHELAIITINYNASEFTKKCVASVLENTPKDLDYIMVIVDNASEKSEFDDLGTFIQKLDSSRLRLERSFINLGFGGGNMFGAQLVKSKYLLFLNNDTLVNKNTIKNCLTFLKNTGDAAVCGPQIRNESGKKEISFDHFTSFAREAFGKSFVESLWRKPVRRKTYDHPITVDYINGSFMCFKAKDFNAVGGFDTTIFLYYEESDICLRLKKLGKKTYFLPNTEYVHHQGVTLKKTTASMTKKIELKTSMLYVIRKHNGYLQYLLLRVFLTIRYGLKTLVSPRTYPLFKSILIGLPLGHSLKQQQKINW